MTLRRRPVRRVASAVAVVLALHAGALAGAPSLDECDALVRDHPEELDAHLCYDGYARVTGDLDGAILRVRALRQLRPEDPRGATALGILLKGRDRDAAVELLDEAAARFAGSGDAAGEVTARMERVTVAILRQQHDEAGRQVALAARAAERSDVPWHRLWVEAEQARLAINRSRFDRAWLLARRVVGDPAFEAMPSKYKMIPLLALSSSASYLGRPDEALRHALRAVEIADRSGDTAMRLDAYATLAVKAEHAYLGGLIGAGEAAAHASRALALARERGSALHELTALKSLAGCARGPAAIADLDRLVQQSERFACWDLAASARMYKAMHLVEGDAAFTDAAVTLLDEALAIATEHLDSRTIALILTWLAEARRLTGPRDRAVADGLAALEAIENLRSEQSIDELRAELFGTWVDAYAALVGYLLDPPGRSHADVELAFRIAERRRARGLLDHLLAARSAEPADAERDAARRRAALLGEIARAQLRLAETRSRPEQARLLERIERLELEEIELRRQIAELGGGGTLQAVGSFPTPDQVRTALDPDEALLAWVVGGEGGAGSWLFALTPEGSRIHRVAAAERLETPAGFWLAMLRAGDAKEPRGAARLYREILGRAIDELPEHVRRLVLVPDAVLHGIPFEALRAAPDARPLGDRFAISVVPSAAVWLRARQRGEDDGAGRALVLADPEVAGGAGIADTRQALLEAWQVGSLPAAEEEGRTVLAAFGGSGTLRLGPRASEAFLKRATLDRYRLVHFAAHAVVDDGRPERSAIVLSAGGPDQDGLLQPREILDLPLRGQVVTLAACRSGTGRVLAGEGPLSLARSFLQAGARTVVASLWPLRDDDARRFFGSFYAHLAEGRPVADALAETRRELIAAGRPAAAWAGVVALGDGRVVLRPAPRPGWVRYGPAIALLLLVVVGGSALLRRRVA